MGKLNQKNFAIASGLTSVVVYLGCFLIMNSLGKGSIVKLSNLLFHGMDFSNIIRMNIPIGQTVLGAFASFILWGSVGYLIAMIYNKLPNKKVGESNKQRIISLNKSQTKK